MATTQTTHLLDVSPLTLHELALAVGADDQWVLRLVEVEILHVSERSSPPEQWHFRSTDLQRALSARRLERDFEANLETAALILDLQEELRRLRGVLSSKGLS